MVGQHDTKIWRKWSPRQGHAEEGLARPGDPLPAPGGRASLQSQLQSRAVFGLFRGPHRYR
jgi:hypothetical protein